MRRIAFVACSKSKAGRPGPAATLYTSALYRKSLLRALTTCRTTYILSAKHGVLPLSERICPYDLTLKRLGKKDRDNWAGMIEQQMPAVLSRGDVAVLYCGEDYIAPIRHLFSRVPCQVDLPLEGLSIGNRLKRLVSQNHEQLLNGGLTRLYKILGRLYVGQDGGRKFKDCSGRMAWPRRGVYFIVDKSTERATAGKYGIMSRVTRVGTHAVSSSSRTTLWDRLSTHRGTADGGGSHRSSIFRLHVGKALLNSMPDSTALDSWGKGQTASGEVRLEESTIERLVSEVIGKMSVLWLNVDDQPGPASDRAYLERNVIGLLSRSFVLAPVQEPSWLGNMSPDYRVPLSGLWNLDHLFRDSGPEFLDVLEEYVDITLSGRTAPERPLAPLGWHQGGFSPTLSPQLSLFPRGGSPDA